MYEVNPRLADPEAFQRRQPTRLTVLSVALWFALANWACAADRTALPPRIEGGADATGHHYNWNVTNNDDQVIVYIEFPHHHADTFTAPPGWEIESRHLVGGGESKTGSPMCAATAPSPQLGIRRGSTRAFQMRISMKGARRGTGEVIVRFADGAEAVVGEVELPQPESVWVRYIRLIGFAVIFLGFLAVRAIWVRRRPSKPPTDAAEA